MQYVPLPLTKPEREALGKLIDKELRRADDGRRKLIEKMGHRANTAQLDAVHDTLAPVRRRLATIDKAE